MIRVRLAEVSWKPRSLSRCCSAAALDADADRDGEGEVEVEMEVGVGVEERNARPLVLVTEVTSARRCEALLASCRSRPRSSRNVRIMDCVSSADKSGWRQKVQGPRPSLTQMTGEVISELDVRWIRQILCCMYIDIYIYKEGERCSGWTKTDSSRSLDSSEQRSIKDGGWPGSYRADGGSGWSRPRGSGLRHRDR